MEDGATNLYYNQDFTKDEVTVILSKIHDCIKENLFTISKNKKRKKNVAFIDSYNMTSIRQRSILLEIQVEDFCHSLKNTKKGFEDEALYVFVPQVNLFNIDGETELVDVYTKFNVIDMDNGARTVIISFHPPNKSIDYLFRKAIKNLEEVEYEKQYGVLC